jgi:hypothetical protein
MLALYCVQLATTNRMSHLALHCEKYSIQLMVDQSDSIFFFFIEFCHARAPGDPLMQPKHHKILYLKFYAGPQYFNCTLKLLMKQADL